MRFKGRSLAVVLLTLCGGCIHSSIPEISPDALPRGANIQLSRQAEFSNACSARGGAVTYGLLAERLCEIKTTDGGKACTSSKQCQSICLAVGGRQGDPAIGECSPTNINLGCPAYSVENGRVEGACVE